MQTEAGLFVVFTILRFSLLLLPSAFMIAKRGASKTVRQDSAVQDSHRISYARGEASTLEVVGDDSQERSVKESYIVRCECRFSGEEAGMVRSHSHDIQIYRC